jgi:REP element-mobilizing transposase RayT
MPQSLSQLYVHLVFTTKHREPLLLPPVRDQMHAYLGTVLKNRDSPALEVGCTRDHVHALFRLSKSISLAKIVEEIKTSSSKCVKTQGRAWANFHWQSGYGGFSVSAADVKEATEYIAQQAEHHRVVTFQEEYRKLLESHGIEYDERYVWDWSLMPPFQGLRIRFVV